VLHRITGDSWSILCLLDAAAQPRRDKPTARSAALHLSAGRSGSLTAMRRFALLQQLNQLLDFCVL